jgi:hypothetical protein
MVDRGVHIDLFFRNGLKEFEVLPPSDVWENIKPVISRKHRSFIFLRAAAIAAIFISVGAISFLLTRSLSDKFNSMVVSLNQETMPEGTYTVKASPVPAILHKKSTNLPVVSVSDISNSVASAGDMYFKLPENELFNAPPKESSLQKKINIDPLNNVILNDKRSSSGKEISYVLVDQGINKSDNTGNRWSIGALASPTYYSSFNTGKNDIAKELVKSDKAAVSYSGGLAFDYKVNKRISVQTGLYYSSYGQEVTGISSFAGFQNYNVSKSGSDFAVETSSGTITTANSNIFLYDNTESHKVVTRYTSDVFDPYKAALQYLDNSILQNFNYLELPFQVKYKVIDRKIDFNLIGGISYNLLVSNSAYSISGGAKYFIGKTEGLSPVTFSSSFGMGMEYSLSSKISLNIEPTFRYYITPVNALVGSTIHPYSFGVLSGFSYKF